MGVYTYHATQLHAVVGATINWGYDAWGKRQIVSGKSEEIHHGYTGHVHLDDGFIYMNGRLYDPELGRFISADLYIQDARDGQGFNRYSYVNNNPWRTSTRAGISISSARSGAGGGIR